MYFILDKQRFTKFASQIAESEDKFDPILVEVYYESMCPDSKYFINHKLVPVMTKLSQYLMLRLIPYGKATVSFLKLA